jgi:hypothetical protein
MTNNIREEIRQLLQQAELTTAFDYVLTAVDDAETQNKFVLLQAQWTEISALYLQGRLSFEDYFKEKNRITFAFLTFLDALGVPSEGKSPLLQVPNISEMSNLNAVKKAFIDYQNNSAPQFPKDPIEREYYSDAFALMLYRTIKNLKK